MRPLNVILLPQARTMPVRRRRAGRRGTPTRRDPRQSPAQEGDAPTEVRTSAACHPTPRALSPPPVSPSGVVPGVASPTPVSRGSGASSQQGESGTAWGEGHARARGAWGEPQVWSPSHELEEVRRNVLHPTIDACTARAARAHTHTKTLPPHTPHRTSHTPRGRSSVCGQGALHRANLRPSPRAAGLTAGQRADDVECAAVASRRRRPGSEDDPG